MIHHPDIDLDFANRDDVLTLFKHHPATIIKNNEHSKHNTGVYVSDIPTDPRNGISSIDYKEADDRGYFKLDFLNVHVYNAVKDEDHLIALMAREPSWKRLWEQEPFCEQVIHINNHYDLVQKMKPDSIPRMAMFLALIRPAKRHLAGKSWREIYQTIWDKPDSNDYYFKKAHAVSYAVLVQVHMNLLEEQS